MLIEQNICIKKWSYKNKSQKKERKNQKLAIRLNILESKIANPAFGASHRHYYRNKVPDKSDWDSV